MASVNLIKFLDKYLGSLLCLFLSVNKFFPNKKNIEHKKILVIQLWGIGETVLALPAIKALRENNKKSSIGVLVTGRVKEIFYNNKNIDNATLLKLNPASILSFILRAYKKFGKQDATDDAVLLERLGKKVSVVLGSYSNIKITTPEDLKLAKVIAKRGA